MVMVLSQNENFVNGSVKFSEYKMSFKAIVINEDVSNIYRP